MLWSTFLDVADSLNRPVVINASIGDYWGSHDGLDPVALYIDSLLMAKPGRFMVGAAGNSGEQPAYHLRTDVTVDTSFTWFLHNTSTGLGFPGAFIELWGDTADLQNVEFSIALDKVTGTFERRGLSAFHNLTSNLGVVVHDTVWNGTDTLATVQYYMEQRDGQYFLQVVLDDPDSSQYNYALLSTGTGAFDLWSAAWLGTNDMETTLPDTTQFPQIAYYVAPDTLQSIVDSWNCSPHVVSVGNYYSRLSYQAYDSTIQTVPGTKDELSSSSSKGPSRLGVVRPTVAATGDMALSAGRLSTLAAAQSSSPEILDFLGMHIRNGGTSMAAPIVSGIGALLLEKCPNMTNDEFIQALQGGAKSDGFTGSLPNHGFGYGKVDGLATLQQTNFQTLINGDPFFCAGGFTILDVPSGYQSYLWHTGTTSMSHAFVTADTAWVEVENSQGCKGVSDTVEVFVAPDPPIPSFSQTGNALLSDPAWDYQWYLDGSSISGATGQQHIAQSSGYYQVQVTNQYGCTSISDSVYISLVGVEEYHIDFSIYPNPALDKVRLETSEPVSFQLLNALGAVIRRGQIQKQMELDLSELAAGRYLIRVENDFGLWTYPLVKR